MVDLSYEIWILFYGVCCVNWCPLGVYMCTVLELKQWGTEGTEGGDVVVDKSLKISGQIIY
jgi:hypothetical protein